MPDPKKLLRDIKALRESLSHDWRDLADWDLEGDHRREVIGHAESCAHELNDLLSVLDHEAQGNS